MKKTIYFLGILLINIFTFGAIFKIQHWPGANILLVIGLGLFSGIFLPLAFTNSYKGNGSKNRQLYISGFLCALICIVGALWKVMHWPGAGWFLIVGVPLPFLYFLPVYVFHHNKEKEKSSLNFLGVMFMMMYIAVFSAMLALNTSRNIINSFVNSAADFATTNELLEANNKTIYEKVEKSGNTEKVLHIATIKAKTEAVCKTIDETKTELIIAVNPNNTKAMLTHNKVSIADVDPVYETVISNAFMRGNNENPDKSEKIKKEIDAYRTFLLGVVALNSENKTNIENLLNTSDKKSLSRGEEYTLSWENRYFSYGINNINILGNLENIETKIRMAELIAISK